MPSLVLHRLAALQAQTVSFNGILRAYSLTKSTSLNLQQLTFCKAASLSRSQQYTAQCGLAMEKCKCGKALPHCHPRSCIWHLSMPESYCFLASVLSLHVFDLHRCLVMVNTLRLQPLLKACHRWIRAASGTCYPSSHILSIANTQHALQVKAALSLQLQLKHIPDKGNLEGKLRLGVCTRG